MAGAKFRIERMPASTIRSATSWTAVAGVAITPIAMPSVRTSAGRSSTWWIDSSPDPLPHLRRIHVDQRGDAEPPFGEPSVVRERMPEVADAGDHDGPVLRQPELAADLVDQVGDVVADAARAVGAQVREVLAHLRRVHARRLGQRLRRDRGGPGFGDVDQRVQVDGQPADGRLGDGPTLRHGRTARAGIGAG